jgi:16S rRNA (guanine527-N7)-methyltransferase
LLILRAAEEFHLFQQDAVRFDVILKERDLQLFRVYLDELWEWNQHVNITGAATREEVLMHLILDSLIPGPHLPEAGNLLDVGSGGGIPGIPLKIYRPDLTVDLLEVKSKRVSFLKHVIRLLQLKGIRVIRGRIDGSDLLPEKESYDVVTARALASPLQTVLWCAPLLRQRGVLVLFLGSDAEKGLATCRGALDRHSMAIEKTIPYILSGKGARRNVVIIKKLTGP